MKLFYPVSQRPFSVNQPFGANYNTYYAEQGYKGHSGIDLPCKFNQSIYASCDAEVFAVRNKDNPNKMLYRAVYTLVEDSTGIYEVSYGHANDIFVKEGDFVNTGMPLISGGNTGSVASGGIKITKEMKDAGSTAGTHLHFQVRQLKRVDKRTAGKQYLTNDGGFFTKDNQYFEVLNVNNGYGGGIDPAQFWNGKFALDYSSNLTKELLKLVQAKQLSYQWYKDLKYGDNNDDVKYAQVAFMITGFMQPIPEGDLGIFGPKTARANSNYQLAHGISPAPNNIGPRTRNALNSQFR